MAITPAVTVAAPEPYGKRYGLLTAAAGPLDLPAGRRGGGITYEPVACGPAHAVALECVDQETPETKTFDDGGAWTEGAAFVAYSTLRCGSVGSGDLVGRVRRQLEFGEQGAVERFLGEQLVASAVAVPVPVATAMHSVVGALEEWLYSEQGYGAVGFIHAPIRLASYMHDGVPLSADSGGRWRTRMGTVMVFGDYPDDGGVFITGHVTTWRAADVEVPPQPQILNRTNNNYYMLAEREWAVAWDCVAGVATYDVEGIS